MRHARKSGNSFMVGSVIKNQLATKPAQRPADTDPPATQEQVLARYSRTVWQAATDMKKMHPSLNGYTVEQLWSTGVYQVLRKMHTTAKPNHYVYTLVKNIILDQHSKRDFRKTVVNGEATYQLKERPASDFQGSDENGNELSHDEQLEYKAHRAESCASLPDWLNPQRRDRYLVNPERFAMINEECDRREQGMTKLERLVSRCSSSGETAAEIGRVLGISADSVDRIRKNLRFRFGQHSARIIK